MALYSDEIIDEIRNNNNIVDVISQYVVLKKKGRNYFGLCPFHNEKSPSFCVSQERQIFNCFGCHTGGDVISFVKKIDNISYKEAIESLAERAGITLPTLNNSRDSETEYLKSRVYNINEIAAKYFHETLYKPESKLAQEYVKKRKLDNKTLKAFMIGYAPHNSNLYKILKENGFKDEEILASSLVGRNDNGTYYDKFKNRLMFPIKDVKERVIAFGGRVLDDSKPKYINSPENIVYSKSRQLYGLNVAKKANSKNIIIVEGYMDAVSLYQRGIENVVASLGTALTEGQGRLLQKYTSEIIIGYDSDGAGQAATMRGLDILQNLGFDVRVLGLEGAKDPDEFVIKYGTGRFNKYVENAISLVEFKVKKLKENLNLEVVGDKIKFLNEVSNLLCKVKNEIEREVYIDKISKNYEIKKEAVYAEINKILYANNQGSKILEKTTYVKPIVKKEESQISENIIKKENMLISIFINSDDSVKQKIKDNIKIEDFKYENNKRIIEKLYTELENKTGKNIIDLLEDDELINHITYIMTYEIDIENASKAIEDIINTYKKERLIEEKNTILSKLENKDLSKEETSSLERDLNKIIIDLAKLR